jgi:DNA (cytosine-5)-methyltransferase 1
LGTGDIRHAVQVARGNRHAQVAGQRGDCILPACGADEHYRIADANGKGKTAPAMDDHTLRFIDLFAGIGGIRRGFELACAQHGRPCECVYTADIEPFACEIYQKNYPHDSHSPLNDVTRIDDYGHAMGRVDVVLAGFPCQAFSIAGAKRGFEDTRGTLFFDVAKIIEDRKPQAFILENVKGLVMHRGGRTLRRILEVLRYDLGYASTQFKLLNSLDFGVPQHRERIYIVGFRDCGGGFAFPRPTDSSKRIRDIVESGPVAAKYYLSEGYLAAARAHRARHEAKGHGFGYEIRSWDDYAAAIVCGGMGRERNLLRDDRIVDRTPQTHIRSPINAENVRRMTPIEWERLQGFPEHWTEGVADTHRYRLLGNSVTVNVVKAVADQLVRELKDPQMFKPTEHGQLELSYELAASV